ncbi:MAG: CBS domain-containing protein [Chloroflexi bacterium]|nr:CBS domain-containing protein [Chloroflexota bacterium]MBI3341290.1 CBS domain-containing protein [Chloroflexota bacterium]
MINVRDLIRKKGGQIFSVKPDSAVLDALKLMAEKNTGAMLVMDGNKVVGILSERDCVRKLELDGRTAKSTKVSEIMTGKVLYVEVSQSLDECMAIMIDKNIRHLPVYEEGKLLGLISVRDVLKEVVDYQKFMITQLEHYISGARQ